MEVFLKYWYFGFHFPEPIYMGSAKWNPKKGSGKWNPKYQYVKKTSIDLLVFQYMLISFWLFTYFITHFEKQENPRMLLT